MSEKTTAAKKWNDEAVTTLLSVVGTVDPVSVDLVNAAAEKLNVTPKSVAAKLRQLDREVASLAVTKAPAFTAEQSEALATFINDNAGTYTYAEIAEKFPGEFTAKQIQGKCLALELTDKVRPAEKVEVARTYTPEQEVKFVTMANGGAFIEDIAAALGKEIASVRGKALSLSRAGQISKIPAQKQSHAKDVQDPVEALGTKLANMTVAEIAAATEKTERGVRTLLTRRGLKVSDYDGAAKKAKAAARNAEAA